MNPFENNKNVKSKTENWKFFQRQIKTDQKENRIREKLVVSSDMADRKCCQIYLTANKQKVN